MTIADVNEFIDGYAHESGIKGTMTFGEFEGVEECRLRHRRILQPLQLPARQSPPPAKARCATTSNSPSPDGRRFTFVGVKYMQKDTEGGIPGIAEILEDYTTLYCHVYEQMGGGALRETGTAYMKFRTFQDLAAVGNLAGFLLSFQVTGTNDPMIQLQARMRFIAFTAQFVQREYDPLTFGGPLLATDVRAAVARGAETPDFFSTRSSAELQKILRDTPTLRDREAGQHRRGDGRLRQAADLPRFLLEGSFAKDTLIGWEERVRDAALGNDAGAAGKNFAGGSFWKRFDPRAGRRGQGLRGELRTRRAARPSRSAHGAISRQQPRLFQKGRRRPAAHLHQRAVPDGLRHHQGDRRTECHRRDAPGRRSPMASCSPPS